MTKTEIGKQKTEIDQSLRSAIVIRNGGQPATAADCPSVWKMACVRSWNFSKE